MRVRGVAACKVKAYVGLIEVIFLPSLLLTHSLLMKRPVGWVYFLPLGAVSSIERSDILKNVPKDLDICGIVQAMRLEM